MVIWSDYDIVSKLQEVIQWKFAKLPPFIFNENSHVASSLNMSSMSMVTIFLDAMICNKTILLKEGALYNLKMLLRYQWKLILPEW